MQKITIIGTGLIGGSLAKALHEKYIIFSISKNLFYSEIFTKQTTIDKQKEVENFIFESDFIFITTPISAYEDIFKIIKKQQNYKKKIITEFGSVKKYPEKLRKILKNINLTHPIAGSDKDGFENSRNDLFKNKLFILDKKNKHNKELINVFSELNVKDFAIISNKKHDKIYATISHFPQFLSFILLDFIKKFQLQGCFDNLNEKFQKFQKFSRLTNSNKKIWIGESEILNLNIKNIEKNWKDFIKFIKKSHFSKASEFFLFVSRFIKKTSSKHTKYLGSGAIDMSCLDGEILSHISNSLNKKEVLEFFKKIDIKKYARGD